MPVTKNLVAALQQIFPQQYTPKVFATAQAVDKKLLCK
jgi:hypothetical protein